MQIIWSEKEKDSARSLFSQRTFYSTYSISLCNSPLVLSSLCRPSSSGQNTIHHVAIFS